MLIELSLGPHEGQLLLEYMKMALLTRRPSKAGSALSAHDSALNHHTPHLPSGQGWVRGECDRAPLGQRGTLEVMG